MRVDKNKYIFYDRHFFFIWEAEDLQIKEKKFDIKKLPIEIKFKIHVETWLHLQLGSASFASVWK